MSEQDRINREGGPAFPVSIRGCGDNGWHGMSLRDWFASQALAGICGDGIAGSHHHPDNTARDAYAYADAMMIERERHEEERRLHRLPDDAKTDVHGEQQQ